MREDPLGNERFLTADRKGIGKLVILRVVIRKSDPTHARVDLDMNFYANAARRGALCKRTTVFARIDTLANVLPRQNFGAFDRRVAENEDRLFYSAAAELKRFLNVGNGKKIRAERLVQARKLDGGMTVGVRLYDTAELYVFCDAFANNAIVLLRTVKVDFRPCAVPQRAERLKRFIFFGKIRHDTLRTALDLDRML